MRFGSVITPSSSSPSRPGSACRMTSLTRDDVTLQRPTPSMSSGRDARTRCTPLAEPTVAVLEHCGTMPRRRPCPLPQCARHLADRRRRLPDHQARSLPVDCPSLKGRRVRVHVPTPYGSRTRSGAGGC